MLDRLALRYHTSPPEVLRTWTWRQALVFLQQTTRSAREAELARSGRETDERDWSSIAVQYGFDPTPPDVAAALAAGAPPDSSPDSP